MPAEIVLEKVETAPVVEEAVPEQSEPVAEESTAPEPVLEEEHVPEPPVLERQQTQVPEELSHRAHGGVGQEGRERARLLVPELLLGRPRAVVTAECLELQRALGGRPPIRCLCAAGLFCPKPSRQGGVQGVECPLLEWVASAEKFEALFLVLSLQDISKFDACATEGCLQCLLEKHFFRTG